MAVEATGMRLEPLNHTAAGKPIVSFQGLRTRLAHENTAWLIEGADPGALFRGSILDLLEHPGCASALGREAHRLAENRYRWRILAEHVERCTKPSSRARDFPGTLVHNSASRGRRCCRVSFGPSEACIEDR
jgi:hypothetical protein